MPHKRSCKRHVVVQPLDQPYRFIPLTQGQNAVVDVEDYDWLSQWNWCALWCPNTKSFYAVSWYDSKHVRMHSMILRCQSEEEGDHIDHDTLNNRRYNLRKVSVSQNGMNRKVKQTNISGFKGVHWGNREQKWRSRIGVARKRISLGYFNSPEEAARAYDEAAKIYHGVFALLNFPKEN